MIDLDERPAAARTDTSDDDLIHVVCCDPNLALCGLDVTGQPYTYEEPAADDPVCETCMVAMREFGGCSAPGCPERIGCGCCG